MHPKPEEEVYVAERGKRRAVVERVADEISPFRTVSYLSGHVSTMPRYYPTKNEAVAYADYWVA